MIFCNLRFLEKNQNISYFLLVLTQAALIFSNIYTVTSNIDESKFGEKIFNKK